MRRTLTISLLLLVLGGCASTYDNTLEGWESPNPNNKLRHNVNYGYKILGDNNLIQIKTAGTIFHKKLNGHDSTWNSLCIQQFMTSLKKTPESDGTIYRMSDGINYKWPNSFSVQCLTSAEVLERQKQNSIRLKNQAEAVKNLEKLKLENKKIKCRDYGFKDDTDGMGLCLIELDKLALLEEQILGINKRNNQVYLQNQQQIADQKRQREAQALINLGAVISGTGTPRRTTPKAPITTYPNSFSSTLTVPSNQVCPILSTPITKQEVRGTNRICYYQ